MRIWITRALPEAEATAARLRDLGHEPLVEPVLEVRPATGAAPDLAGVGALAFTSRNGVRAFAVLWPERGLPVFTVGEATAAAAREAGFATVESAGGDATALAELIAARREAFAGEVLYAAPEEPANDLVQALAARGIAARARAVYATVPLAPPPAALAALDEGRVDAVLVHSAKAARQLAASPELRRAAPRLRVYAISPPALAPLRDLGFLQALAAPHPDEASLLALLPTAPPRLFTPLYWAMIGFGLLCILAAVVVATLGPRLFPGRPARPAATPASPAASNSAKNSLRARSPGGPP